MPAASLLFSDATQEDALARLHPLLLAINRARPLTFVEPIVGGGSLGLFLLEQRAIDHLYLNTDDAGAFAFLQIALGKSCGNRREVNWLLKWAAVPRWEAERANASEDPNCLRMQALYYVNRQVAEVVAAGIAIEPDFRDTVVAHIELLHAQRVRVKGVSGLHWSAFIEQLQPNYGDNRLYHFNASRMGREDAEAIARACRGLPVRWTLCAPQLPAFSEFACPALDGALGARWYSDLTSLSGAVEPLPAAA
jgi:hypothetical protein